MYIPDYKTKQNMQYALKPRNFQTSWIDSWITFYISMSSGLLYGELLGCKCLGMWLEIILF